MWFNEYRAYERIRQRKRLAINDDTIMFSVGLQRNVLKKVAPSQITDLWNANEARRVLVLPCNRVTGLPRHSLTVVADQDAIRAWS
jgi:hypothetical protein